MTQHSPDAGATLSPVRRTALRISWWVLGLVLVGGTVFPVLCFCPEQYYLTGAVSLIPLFFGVKGHRWVALAVLALSIFGAIHEVRGARREHERMIENRRRAEQREQTPDLHAK